MQHRPTRALGVVALTIAGALAAAPSASAAVYSFTRVADSVEDGFDQFAFGCAAINTRGDIAFRAGRLADDGFNVDDGIYLAGADETLTTIAEDPKRFRTLGSNPSINDVGQVSFAARIDGGRKDDTESIMRSDGKKLVTIASTAGIFNFFGFDTSINDLGEVAFKAELDEELNFDEGLFSGTGGRKAGITTHYLASSSAFDGDDTRPSINDAGEIAFRESVEFESGVFAGQEGSFTTIAAPDPDVFVGEPTINDAGIASFERSFTEAETQVTEIVTGSGGALTTVADTRGAFSSFGFRPPSINAAGDVAFLATLDDGTTGIFTGPDPVADRVIATGDPLDGAVVLNLVFCEQGLSDGGEIAFVATLDDPTSPDGTRVAVFRGSVA